MAPPITEVPMKSFNTHLSDISLLYVEDEPSTMKTILSVISMKYPGLSIHAARNGEAGLELFKQCRPQIVLTDINMPVMNGIEMTRNIRLLDSRVDVIAATAFSDSHYLMDAINVGISRYVLKPVDFNLLFAAIDDCLARIGMERQVKEQDDLIRKLSRAVEQSPSMVMITDAAGAIEYVNPKFTAITGYAAPEVMGKNLRSVMTSASPVDIFEAIWSTVTGGSEWRGEIMNRKKDGELYCEDICISSLAGVAGETTHYVAVMEDISGRKRAEEALRDSEILIKQSQSAARIGSYKADFGSGSWESTEVLDQILGIDRSHARNLRGWLDLVHPDDAEMMGRYLEEEVLVRRRSINKEFRIIRKSDGEIRRINGLGKLNLDAEGNIVSISGTVQDITDSKRTGEELKQFHALCNFAPIGIFRTDWEGNNIYSNPRWEAITGMSAAQAKGKGWLKAVHPDDVKRLSAAWLKSIVTGELYTLEHRVITPRGAAIWVRALASSIKGADGQIEGFVGTLECITEPQQARLEKLRTRTPAASRRLT